MRLLLAACLSLWPLGLLAGSPTEETAACPVGGETVHFTGTASCSSGYGSFYMSFREATTCDFVDVLPQCPVSRIPLYRDFSPEEARRLEDLVKTPAYAEASGHSRFYLAWFIETHLTDDAALGLLVGGLTHDAEATQSDPDYMAAFVKASEGTTGADRAFLWALEAYAEARHGRPDAARALIAKVRATPEAEGTLTPAYVAKVEACLDRPQTPDCAPDALIELGD